MVKYNDDSPAIIKDLILIDYGFINNAELAVTPTGDNWVGGTPEYLDPSYVIHPQKLTYKADIWAMGVTLYYYYIGNTHIFDLPRSPTALRLGGIKVGQYREICSRSGETALDWTERLLNLPRHKRFPRIRKDLEKLHNAAEGSFVSKLRMLLFKMLQQNPTDRPEFIDLAEFAFFDTDPVDEEGPPTVKGAIDYRNSFGAFAVIPEELSSIEVTEETSEKEPPTVKGAIDYRDSFGAFASK